MLKRSLEIACAKLFSLGLRGYSNVNSELDDFALKTAERKNAFAKIAMITDSVPGDYLEFGVYKGDSLILAYERIAKCGRDRNCRFFGFDSFEGLPEPRGKDDRQAGWKKGRQHADHDETYRKLSKRIESGRFELIKGFFEDTLNEERRARLGIERAKVILIDCVMYESARRALDFCVPLVGPGTVIIFDDFYNSYNYADPNTGGEARAFAEFMQKVDLVSHSYYGYGFGGQSFILHSSSCLPITSGRFSSPTLADRELEESRRSEKASQRPPMRSAGIK